MERQEGRDGRLAPTANVIEPGTRNAGFWFQLLIQTRTQPVLAIFKLYSHANQDTTTTSEDLAEAELMPGDHWIHRDLTPVVRTVRISNSDFIHLLEIQ